MAMLAMGGESMIPTSIPMIEVPDPEWDEWTPRCVVDEPDGPYEPRSGGTIRTSLPPHLQKLVEDLEREDDEESSFPWDEEFPPEDLDGMLTEVKCKLEAMYSASLDVNDNTSVGVVPALDVTTADEPPPLQPEPPQLRLTPPEPPMHEICVKMDGWDVHKSPAWGDPDPWTFGWFKTRIIKESLDELREVQLDYPFHLVDVAGDPRGVDEVRDARRRESLKQVMELLCCDRNAAAMLLRFFRWDQEKLLWGSPPAPPLLPPVGAFPRRPLGPACTAAEYLLNPESTLKKVGMASLGQEDRSVIHQPPPPQLEPPPPPPEPPEPVDAERPQQLPLAPPSPPLPPPSQPAPSPEPPPPEPPAFGALARLLSRSLPILPPGPNSLGLPRLQMRPAPAGSASRRPRARSPS